MKLSKDNEIRIKEVDNGAIIQCFEETIDENGDPWTKTYNTIIEGKTNSYGTRKEYMDYLVELFDEVADILGYSYNKHEEWNLDIKRKKNRNFGRE